MLVEAGIMIGLATVLNTFKIFTAPMGGSITAGSMIPILLFALRWGVGPGMFAGATFGVLKLILGGSIYTPVQAILEYPVAFALLGIAGMYSTSFKTDKETNYFKLVLSIFLAIGGRFLCHFIAGIVFFGKYAEGMHPWLYSLLYQATYLIPEFIISALILSLIWKPLNRMATE